MCGLFNGNNSCTWVLILVIVFLLTQGCCEDETNTCGCAAAYNNGCGCGCGCN